MRQIIAIVCILCLAAPAVAETFTETFEGGSNAANWTWTHYDEGINPAGGNPDSWFYAEFMFTSAPLLQCGSNAPMFTGDYVSMGVTRLSADFQTNYCENSGAYAFPMTVVLRDENGTPLDPEDDVFVYPDPWATTIPWIGDGWVHYDYDIPSDFVGAPGELPTGWVGGSHVSGNAIFPADVTFQEVLQNVSRVEFNFLHPDYAALIVPWSVGADNVAITWDSAVATESVSLGTVKAMYR
jgi:hypothetical protein